jgi:hypothetical protein
MMFVLLFGELPSAVSDSLQAAQAEAVGRATEYDQPDRQRELQWDERPTTQYSKAEWLLKSRTGGRGRFSQTGYRVVEVPVVGRDLPEVTP